MRPSLLASAIASTLRCSRFLAASIQGLSLWRSELLGLISTTQAACTNRTRRLAIAALRLLVRLLLLNRAAFALGEGHPKRRRSNHCGGAS